MLPFLKMTIIFLQRLQIEFEQMSGTFIVPSAKTVADLLEEYTSVYGVSTWAMSTYEARRGLMFNYIIPIIGDMKPDDLNTCYGSLLSELAFRENKGHE